MGSSSWSDATYKARVSTRAATGTPTFAYSAAAAAMPAHSRVAHKSLDPKGVKMRESRDSTEHPTSNAIAVMFDVTGSMGSVPQVLQQKLPKLMGLLVSKNYIADPQIMSGGIGDATCDTVPMQIGQFESGIEIENDLTNIYLEGGGGGQKCESYDLALYFMAKHTSIDCWEKRQKKGYIFIIGDEMCRERISPHEVEQCFGDKLGEPLQTKDVVRELQERYNVFFILPKMTSYYNDKEVWESWTSLLGEDNCVKLEAAEGVCELIASLIGICESSVDVDTVASHLTEAGTAISTVSAVTTAVSRVARSGAMAPSVTVNTSGGKSGVTPA